MNMNDDTMKLGLLMESVQVQQKLVEENLAALKAHTRDLDGIVRDEIRRTLIEEFEALTAEGQRAASALRAMGRAAGLRMAIWSLALSALCTVIPGAPCSG
jgi:thioredoxin-like negative regulator of GroEL